MDLTDWHEAQFGMGRFAWVDKPAGSQYGRLVLDGRTAYAYEPFPKAWFTQLREANDNATDTVAQNLFSGMIATWSPITTAERDEHEAATIVRNDIAKLRSNAKHQFSLTADELFVLTSRFYGVLKEAYAMQGQLIGAAQDLDKHKRNALAGALAFVLEEVEGLHSTEAKGYGFQAFKADCEDAIHTYQSLSQTPAAVVTPIVETTSLPRLCTVERGPES